MHQKSLFGVWLFGLSTVRLFRAAHCIAWPPPAASLVSGYYKHRIISKNRVTKYYNSFNVIKHLILRSQPHPSRWYPCRVFAMSEVKRSYCTSAASQVCNSLPTRKYRFSEGLRLMTSLAPYYRWNAGYSRTSTTHKGRSSGHITSNNDKNYEWKDAWALTRICPSTITISERDSVLHHISAYPFPKGTVIWAIQSNARLYLVCRIHK